MKKNIFVIFTAFLAVVALLFTIATLQSELRNVVRNQAVQTSEILIARGMYADDSMYKALDKSNTSEHEIIPYNGRSSLLQVHQLYLREIKTKEHLH